MDKCGKNGIHALKYPDCAKNTWNRLVAIFKPGIRNVCFHINNRTKIQNPLNISKNVATLSDL
jgi:hypothetical protein